MKKIFAVLSLVVFCSVIFTGCSSSSIVGTWKGEEMDSDGNKMICTITFNEDNTAISTVEGGSNITKTWIWTQAEGNKYFIKRNKNDSDDDGIFIEINGGEFKWDNIVFIKQ